MRGDVDVIELHDCFSTNELITYEALGLCPEGETNLRCMHINNVVLCCQHFLLFAFNCTTKVKGTQVFSTNLICA